jgi:hypothetical protein
MTKSWTALRTEAPDLARAITDRFNANLHHVLGTIRPDGSIRLSGTEVAINDDQVGIGMMPHSHKLRDVHRDPRVELHSAPLEDDLSNGDAKLAGILVDAGDTDGQPGTAFTLDVTNASLVRVIGDQLEFTTWSPSTGLRVTHRR